MTNTILLGVQTITTSIVSDCKKLCFVNKPPLTISTLIKQIYKLENYCYTYLSVRTTAGIYTLQPSAREAEVEI